VVATSAGHEPRNANPAAARARRDVASRLKSQQRLDPQNAFLRARTGKAYGFRSKDWTDLKAGGQAISIGDDTETEFQLVKRYPSSGIIETRTITKPVVDTVRIYLDGVEQLSGWSVDPATGVVTFSGRTCPGRRDHRRLRVRRAGAVRHRPHGGDHRDLSAPSLAADPDRRASELR
jgi:uncharacterized protein (TIGR02217 family)